MLWYVKLNVAYTRNFVCKRIATIKNIQKKKLCILEHVTRNLFRWNIKINTRAKIIYNILILNNLISRYAQRAQNLLEKKIKRL